MWFHGKLFKVVKETLWRHSCPFWQIEEAQLPNKVKQRTKRNVKRSTKGYLETYDQGWYPRSVHVLRTKSSRKGPKILHNSPEARLGEWSPRIPLHAGTVCWPLQGEILLLQLGDETLLANHTNSHFRGTRGVDYLISAQALVDSLLLRSTECTFSNSSRSKSLSLSYTSLTLTSWGWTRLSPFVEPYPSTPGITAGVAR